MKLTTETYGLMEGLSIVTRALAARSAKVSKRTQAHILSSLRSFFVVPHPLTAMLRYSLHFFFR